MGFTLKKILASFLMPLSVGLIFLFIGLLFLYAKSYKKAKLYLSFAFVWLLLISYAPFSNAVLKPLENVYPSLVQLPQESIEYVVVLGNGHTSNESLSRVSQHSVTALMRLNEGIRIYRELQTAKLIFTGYGGKDKNSHAYMQQQLAIQLGVNEADIIIDEAPRDTSEEAQAIKRIVEHKPFILVTSASHMPRAMKIFEDNWLNPIAAPTDYHVKNEAVVASIPNAKSLRKTELAAHEYLGILWHKIKSAFN
jgi:uncharacterized SAM-binding protein YcdF (DUF218 family)